MVLLILSHNILNICFYFLTPLPISLIGIIIMYTILFMFLWWWWVSYCHPWFIKRRCTNFLSLLMQLINMQKCSLSKCILLDHLFTLSRSPWFHPIDHLILDPGYSNQCLFRLITILLPEIHEILLHLRIKLDQRLFTLILTPRSVIELIVTTILLTVSLVFWLTFWIINVLLGLLIL
jgi:hypothetical protein